MTMFFLGADISSQASVSSRVCGRFLREVSGCSKRLDSWSTLFMDTGVAGFMDWLRGMRSGSLIILRDTRIALLLVVKKWVIRLGSGSSCLVMALLP